MSGVLKNSVKWVVIVISAILLSTLGIDAADHAGDFSHSIIGRILPGGEDQALCPPDMVHVINPAGGFCVDKFEASAGSGCSAPNPISQADTRINLADVGCAPVSVAGAPPWTYVSRDQAETACVKAGKRLPTNQEWHTAALGTPDLLDSWTADDCQVAGNWAGQPGSTGSGKNCVSGAGAFDMIGNVWEWVAGAAEDGMFEGRDLPDQGFVTMTDGDGFVAETSADQPDPNYNHDYVWIKKQGIRGLARGGYWDNGDRAGQYSAYLVSQPSAASQGVGFRCVK